MARGYPSRCSRSPRFRDMAGKDVLSRPRPTHSDRQVGQEIAFLTYHVEITVMTLGKTTLGQGSHCSGSGVLRSRWVLSSPMIATSPATRAGMASSGWSIARVINPIPAMVVGCGGHTTRCERLRPWSNLLTTSGLLHRLYL